MIEDDAVLREADELDLLEEEYEVLVSRPPHQQRLVHPVGTHVLLQDTEISCINIKSFCQQIVNRQYRMSRL